MSSLLQSSLSYIRRITPRGVYLFIKNFYRYLATLKYKGNHYQCLFCNGKFSLFLPAGLNIPVLMKKQVVGGGYRLNSTCPRCFSGDRERLLYLYLKNVRPDVFLRNTKLLHVAPEENLGFKLKSCRNIDYVSADLNSQWADLQMDITDIKQADYTYDVIICNHVLEHVPDDLKAMTELYRVLKKGGFAILQVPMSYSSEKTLEDPGIINPEDRKKSFGQEDHVRIYGKDYAVRLEKAGFTVNVVDYVKEMDSSLVLKYGLLKDEKIFLCFK